MGRMKINPQTGSIHFINPYIGKVNTHERVDVSMFIDVHKYLYTPEELLEEFPQPFTIQLTIFHELARKWKKDQAVRQQLKHTDQCPKH